MARNNKWELGVRGRIKVGNTSVEVGTSVDSSVSPHIKAAEEAKKEEDAKRALTLQRRKGTSAPYGSI